MKKLFEKALIFVCLLSFVLPLLAACKSSPTEEPTEEDTAGKYVWTYNQAFADEHDADMVIDGVLNEEKWQGQHYLEWTEGDVTLRYTTVFTSYGVYIGAHVQDKKIRWKGRFNFAGFWQDSSFNSAFGFKIQGKDVTEEHATTVFNFFIDAKNAASRNQTHFEAASATNGDVDKGTATEMTAELFVSWQALNIKVPATKTSPDYIRIFPAYRHVVSTVKAESNRWLYPLFTEYGESRLLCRSRFNKDGYMNYDREGAVLGDAANGIAKSDGWDLSRIAATRSSVSSDTAHNQAIFFKGIKSYNYSYTTHIVFNNASWGSSGHAGVCDMINADLFNARSWISCRVSSAPSSTCKPLESSFMLGLKRLTLV